MSKYLLKFIKNILSSSKDWTGVGVLSCRDVHWHHIGLYIELILKSQTQLQQKLTMREPLVMGILLEKKPEKKPELDC